MNRSAVPPPVTQVMDEAEAWLPRPDGAPSRSGSASWSRATATRSAATRARRSGPAASACARCSCCCAPGPTPRRRRSAAPRRSSWSTWRRSSTTTSSTRPRFAAACRRWWPPRAASARPRSATSCSRARSPSSARATAPAASARSSSSPAPPWAWRSASSRSAATPGTSTTSAERYLERCRLKTARLFECACLIGRVSGVGRSGRRGAPLVRQEIGLAFQLLDDVLDVAGPPERTGKARGTDLLDGTVTLPLILARERDPELAALDLRSLDERRRRGGVRPHRRRPAPSTRSEPTRAAGWPRRSERSRHATRSRKPSAACSRWSPTAWSSATPRRCRAPCLARGVVRLEVFGEDEVRLERLQEPLDVRSPCSLARAPGSRPGPPGVEASSASSKRSATSCEKTPSSRHSHSGQRRLMLHPRRPAGSQSTGYTRSRSQHGQSVRS